MKNSMFEKAKKKTVHLHTWATCPDAQHKPTAQFSPRTKSPSWETVAKHTANLRLDPLACRREKNNPDVVLIPFVSRGLQDPESVCAVQFPIHLHLFLEGRRSTDNPCSSISWAHLSRSARDSPAHTQKEARR